MKKFFVSVGLIAAGTASLHGAYAPDWDSMKADKWGMWRASGTLRGFYDDNYSTASSGSDKGSFGFEFSPQFEINVPLQQTELGFRMIYGLYYYQEREHLGQDPIDQTEQADFWLDHAFSERWQAKVQDSLAVGQEPELIDPNTSVATRSSGNNLSNRGSLILNTAWTRLFSTALTYQNYYFDYSEKNGTVANPSLAGLLNRIDQSIALDFQWRVAPETVALVGGQVQVIYYTGDEPIAQNPSPPGQIYMSDIRDARSYYAYVGMQRSMLANLGFTGKIGAQYTDNYNDPSSSTSLNPYADLSLVYTYLPGCYAQIGFTEMQNATDQVRPDSSGHITLNTLSSTLYASVNHKLTPKLMGSVIGRWQHSIFNGGFYDNQSTDFYNFDLNLSYTFTRHWSADLGYNFDNYVSDIPGQNYSRNRVYMGVTGTY